MKYPKLFDGSHAIGEALVRSFDRSTPYLTIQAGEARARKQGAFRSVSVERPILGDPFIATQYFEDASGDLLNFRVSPYRGTEAFAPVVEPAPGGFYDTPYRAFVGDEYIVTYINDTGDIGSLTTYYWFLLERAEHPTPIYPPGDPDGAGASVDLYPFVAMTGLPKWSLQPGMIGLGYRDATDRFVFAVSWCASFDSGLGELWRSPRMAIGTTGARTLVETTLPYEDGRNYAGFYPISTGKGEVQYLQLAFESRNIASWPYYYFLPQINPSIVYSTDYGATWTEAEATFLIEFLNSQSPVLYDRWAYNNYQLRDLGRYSSMYYVGGDKVLLIITAAVRPAPDGGDPSYWSYNANFNPALFIGDKLTNSFVRLSWVADDWCVDEYGRPRRELLPDFTSEPIPADYYQLGLRRMTDLHQAHLCFGEGCLYIPIIPYTDTNYAANTIETTGWKIMFTTDFGSTWQTTTVPLPDAVQNVGAGSPAGTVLRPYISVEQPGQILFSAVSASGRVEMWLTTGRFDSWRLTNSEDGATPPPMDNTDEFLVLDPGIYGVNYGDGKDMRKSIYPAFPGEFEA